MRFIQTEIHLKNTENWLTIEPFGEKWIGLNQKKELYCIDTKNEKLSLLKKVEDDCLDPSEEIILRVSPTSRYVAIVNAYGKKGVILDVSTGQKIMELDRGDYRYACYSKFPVAFFEHQQEEYIVHAVDWNKLRITNLSTGKVEAEGLDEKEEYFHGSLTISPDARYIIDNGWVWHPIGVLISWDLFDCLKKGSIGVEEGGKGLIATEAGWDRPLCFFDSEKILLLGKEDEETYEFQNGLSCFQIESGNELFSFSGPDFDVKSKLIYDDILYIVSETGTTGWDIWNGECLFTQTDFVPYAYHRINKEFISVDKDSSLLLSKWVD